MEALERLHYVTGRRLRADDLALEQHYHIAIRRLLNRGLFTPGVVDGLGVTRHGRSQTEVDVDAGLALDPCGRETYLPHPLTIPVPARPAATPPGGYFLVITYSEQPVAGVAG